MLSSSGFWYTGVKVRCEARWKEIEHGGMSCTKFADMFKENEKMLDKITKLALGGWFAVVKK